VDLHLVDPEQIPVPPEQVRALQARAEPFPDRRRVKVSVSLTPFLERPDVELRIVDDAGVILAEASVIECTDSDFALTLHLRPPPASGHARLEVTVQYPDRALEHGLSIDLTLPPSG
jgi:hypothetical protein